MAIIRAETHLQESLETIVRLLERHRVLEGLAQRHEGPRRELVEQLMTAFVASRVIGHSRVPFNSWPPWPR